MLVIRKVTPRKCAIQRQESQSVKAQICKPKHIDALNTDDSDSEEGTDPATLMSVHINNPVNVVTVKPIHVTMNINDTNVRMELDSGSPVSLMPTSLFREYFPQLALQQADLQLSTFTGEALKVLGYANVTVKYEQQTYSLKIYVVDAGRTPLFGRDWLQHTS